MLEEAVTSSKRIDLKKKACVSNQQLHFDTAVCSTWKNTAGFLPVSISAQFKHEIESTCVNCHTSMFV